MLINLKEEVKHFSKINIDTISSSVDDKEYLQEVTEAAKLYNNAIERVEQNNTDIAIIELRKAIKIIPEFYEAIMLLGLCYFSNGETGKAVTAFNSIKDTEERIKSIEYFESLANQLYDKSVLNYVSKADKASIKAKANAKQNAEIKEDALINDNSDSNKIISNIKSRVQKSREASKGKVPKIESKGVFKEKAKSVFDNPNLKKGVIYTFLFIIIAILSVYLVQSIKNLQEADSPVYVKLENDYKSQLERANENEEKYNNLSSGTGKVYKQYLLPIIEDLYENKNSNKDELVELFSMIDVNLFTDKDDKNKVVNMRNDILDIYSDDAYKKGQDYYNDKEYEQAIVEYEKIVKNFSEYDQMQWVLLNLSKSYINTNKNANAIETLDLLLRDYGKSAAANQGAELLNDLLIDTNSDRTPVPVPSNMSSSEP